MNNENLNQNLNTDEELKAASTMKKVIDEWELIRDSAKECEAVLAEIMDRRVQALRLVMKKAGLG